MVRLSKLKVLQIVITLHDTFSLGLESLWSAKISQNRLLLVVIPFPIGASLTLLQQAERNLWGNVMFACGLTVLFGMLV